MRMPRFREIKSLAGAHTAWGSSRENLNPVQHIWRSDFYPPGFVASWRVLSAWPTTWPEQELWADLSYHPLACAGQLTSAGSDTGELFPPDPVWAALSVVREVSGIISSLAHPLSLNLFLSLCLPSDRVDCKSARCSPMLPSCSYLVGSLGRAVADVYSPLPRSRAPKREAAAAESGAILQVKAALVMRGMEIAPWKGNVRGAFPPGEKIKTTELLSGKLLNQKVTAMILLSCFKEH